MTPEFPDSSESGKAEGAAVRNDILSASRGNLRTCQKTPDG